MSQVKTIWGCLISLEDDNQVYNLSQNSIIIGSSQTSDIIIDNNKKICSNHCRIIKQKFIIQIQDMSDNGIFINDQKVGKNNIRQLNHDDKIWLLPKARFTKISKGFKIQMNFKIPSLSFKVENKQEQVSPQKFKKINNSLREQIKCSLCYSIMYHPVISQPCNHRSCGACLSDLLNKKFYKCIQCRQQIKQASADHTFNSIIENYLLINPHQQRSKQQLDDHDKRNIIKNQKIIVSQLQNRRMSLSEQRLNNRFNIHSFQDTIIRVIALQMAHRRIINQIFDTIQYSISNDQSQQRSNSIMSTSISQHSSITLLPIQSRSDLYSSSQESSISGSTIYFERCSQCQEQRNGFKCRRPFQQHYNCFSCSKVVAKRQNPPNPQQCIICKNYYCNLYMPPCTTEGAKLNQLKYYHNKCILNDETLRNNLIELKILSDYLKSKRMRVNEIFSYVFDNFIKNNKFEFASSKKMMANPPQQQSFIKIKQDSPVCSLCWPELWFQMIVIFRQSITKQLPIQIRQKPNCCQGVNCYMVRNNLTHAQKFNHMVQQTSL